VSDFISNLVRKASGSSLLTRPQPSLRYGSQLSSYGVVSGEGKLQADASQEHPLTSGESFDASEGTSMGSIFESPLDREQIIGKPAYGPIEKARIDIARPGEEFQRLDQPDARFAWLDDVV